MKLLNSLINNNPDFQRGYQCAIDDLKIIFENAKIFNSEMKIIDLVEDWEKIIDSSQKKLFHKSDH